MEMKRPLNSLNPPKYQIKMKRKLLHVSKHPMTDEEEKIFFD